MPSFRVFLTVAVFAALASAQDPVSVGARTYLSDRFAELNQYYLYKDDNSALNHGVPSGLFASPISLIVPGAINAACVYSPASSDGCATDTKMYDRTRGTVLRLKVPQLGANQFYGLTFEEPERYGETHMGMGLDLSGIERVIFDITTIPQSCQVRIAVRGSETPFLNLPSGWSTNMAYELSELNPPLRRMEGTHQLFTVVTDGDHCPMGGSVLLDNVRFDPPPTNPLSMPASRPLPKGFPIANATFGVIPVGGTCKTPNAAIPPDQVNRNLAPIYESSLALLWLLTQGQDTEAEAKVIADTFVYALNHPNQGLLFPSPPLPLPPSPSPSTDPDAPAILNNAYMAGDIALANDQPPSPKGKYARRGDSRLAGFTLLDSQGNEDFCLVLDGATGGNNAFAILALVAASRRWEGSAADGDYLRTARRIGKWIGANLRDERPLVRNKDESGFLGGFFIGWNDGGDRSNLGFLLGKSVENNADIYSAMRILADRERETGDVRGLASYFDQLGTQAGAFVLSMFDTKEKRFVSGTVPCSQTNNSGIITGSCTEEESDQKYEVKNVFDFLDAQTFVILPLAASVDYRNAIDWTEPIRSFLTNEAVTANNPGLTLQGFDLVQPGVKFAESPCAFEFVDSGPDSGIAWEFTGQAVVAMQLLDSLSSKASQFTSLIQKYRQQIQLAHSRAPFADLTGMVAATFNNVEQRDVYDQRFVTPFQCIAPRIGLAATMWGAFAQSGFNPFQRQ